jgi:hypothetical protein
MLVVRIQRQKCLVECGNASSSAANSNEAYRKYPAAYVRRPTERAMNWSR